jgi:hypothetical protein
MSREQRAMNKDQINQVKCDLILLECSEIYYIIETM